MERFLITTALEETWRSDVPVVFLGEWCRLFSRKNRWEAMDAEVVPYHWEDFAKFSSDYARLGQLYERLLPRLGAELNRIHGTAHGTRYWRILVGAWLGMFTQIVFDRWSSIQQALRVANVTGTIIRSGDRESWVPNDMADFVQLMTGDEWNHRIFAGIIQHCTKLPVTTISGRPRVVPPASASSGLKGALLKRYGGATRRLVRRTDAFFLATYLPLWEEIRLQLRFRQIPQLWRSVPAKRTPIDWKSRDWDWKADSEDEFEQVVMTLIPSQLPTAFLEGYRELMDQVDALPWPRSPKMIYSSNLLFYDTVAMAYSAQRSAEGTPIAYSQHGGNYFLMKLHWGEQHEVVAADRFLSWGFESSREPKIKPVCYVKPYFSRSPSARFGKLVLITHNNPRYTYLLYSGEKGRQVLTSYLKNAFAFVESVLPTCGKDLHVRLTRTEYGWSFFERWRERFPFVTLDRGAARMEDLISDARLVVCTYASTAFAEALASDVPAMIFWDPQVDPIAESAAPYFDELAKAGVFHATPESAAAKVTAVWEDVDGWWKSAPVQAALARFRNGYFRSSGNRVAEIEAALRVVAGYAGAAS